MMGLHLVEQTAMRLKLERMLQGSARQLLAKFGFGSLAIAVAIGQISGSNIMLKCQRLEPAIAQCDLKTTRLLTRHSEKIEQLRGAELEDSDDTDRVVLLTAAGKVPFDYVYTNFSRQEKRETIQQIQQFVESPQQQELNVSQETRWLSLLFTAPFILFGLWMLIAELVTECSLDKSTGQLVLKKVGVFRTSLSIHLLQDIRSIEVVEKTDSDGNKSYTTKLLLKLGSSIPLDLLSSTTNPEAIAQAFQDFLQVPLNLRKG